MHGISHIQSSCEASLHKANSCHVQAFEDGGGGGEDIDKTEEKQEGGTNIDKKWMDTPPRRK